MPNYQTTTRRGALDLDLRAAFAADVTRIHCDLTGAPPSFVRVLHFEDDNSRLDGSTTARVIGNIRSGRSDETKGEIARQIGAALAGRLGTDPDSISVTLRDNEASWTMEAGRIIPEPGSPEEDAWKQWASET